MDSKLLNKIRSEFISGKKTLQEAADENKVSYSTLSKISSKENWKEAKEKCAQDSEKTAIELTTKKCARDIERFYTIGNRLLDKAENQIENIVDADDLVKIANAMSKIKDVLDLRSKEDRDEQKARIEKLRREAERNDDKDLPSLNIVGLPEEFKK